MTTTRSALFALLNSEDDIWTAKGGQTMNVGWRGLFQVALQRVHRSRLPCLRSVSTEDRMLAAKLLNHERHRNNNNRITIMQTQSLIYCWAITTFLLAVTLVRIRLRLMGSFMVGIRASVKNVIKYPINRKYSALDVATCTISRFRYYYSHDMTLQISISQVLIKISR